MDLLRISTAGSVDDGKSTLIGRLLHDTNSLTQDQLANIDNASKSRGLDFLDLSLFTDGLTAEREQGITIDVAHIYFATDKRKYIIADTPGHVEYTRNMVTGASNSSASLILVDARNGVLEQTYRHFYISTLLRIPEIVVCINKMDLVGYSEEAYNKIVADFEKFVKEITFPGQKITFIPISSLVGDNVVDGSSNMNWYTGKTLLDYIESIDVTEDADLPSRFQIQHVIRPKTEKYHDYRGYAGRVASGVFKVGDSVTVLPTGTTSTIEKIDTLDGELQSASANDSTTFLLKDDVDLSRGNMIVLSDKLPNQSKEFKAQLCWLDNTDLNLAGRYEIQHGVHRVKAKVTGVDYVISPKTLEKDADRHNMKLNDIGFVSVKTAEPILFDSFEANKANGSFILIDSNTNNTVAVGFYE